MRPPDILANAAQPRHRSPFVPGLGGSKLREALKAIEYILEPGPPDGCENKCESCRWEATEALRLVRAALASAAPHGKITA